MSLLSYRNGRMDAIRSTVTRRELKIFRSTKGPHLSMLRSLEKLARSSGRLTLIHADAQRLPLRDGSIREPVLSYIGEPLDFDAVLGEVAARVEEVIRERGTFRAVNRSGVFACR